MNSIKESLLNTIERLNDEEARQVLEFITQRLRKKSKVSLTLNRLVSDPTFKIPSEEIRAFRVVKPIQGKGIAASRLLVSERR